MSTRRIRKQVYELSVDDFTRFPIWEFALDEEGEEGQDEATVRPYQPNGPLNPSDGMFVVRTQFQLADGTSMPGYLTPPVQGDSSVGTLQPIVITEKGQVVFWCGSLAPSAVEINASYKRLGKSSATEVFPLKFESAIPIEGGAIRGELQGFLVLEDFKSMRTKVVK
jgi:hypothetical protein